MAADQQQQAGDPNKPSTGELTADKKVRDWILKTAAAIIGSLGLAGSMVVIGSAVLWIRFKEAGLPAIQAVSVQPREEALVQGAQTTIVFVLIALVVVAALYVIDARELEAEREKDKKKGETESTSAKPWSGYHPAKGRAVRPADPHPMGHWTKRAILLLPILGVAWAKRSTDLNHPALFGLAGLALFLAFCCLWMAHAESKNIWALAAAVFVSVIVFAGTAGYLIVKQQKFIQAVAVLRAKDDAGLTGFYVTTTSDKLYLASPVNGGDRGPELMAIKKVDLGESVTYSIGPLQSIGDAERTSEAMLHQLEEDREGLHAVAAPLPSWVPEKIAATFTGKMEAKEEASDEPLCLMRFAEMDQQNKKRSFWTSCAEAEAQATIDDARERLALPGRFQKAYEVRVKTVVPKGTKLHYAEGSTAPQCGGAPGGSCGRRYPGGGLQYWIEDPSKLGEITLECTKALPDQESKWEPCKS